MDYSLSGAWTFSEQMLIDLLSTGSPGTKFHEIWIKIAQNDKYRQEHGSAENNIHPDTSFLKIYSMAWCITIQVI